VEAKSLGAGRPQRAQVLAILEAHQEDLRQFGVKALTLFGYVARDEARLDSDVDLLVDFAKPVGLFTFMRLQRHLEQWLGRAVDLGTPDSLRPKLRESVFQETVVANLLDVDIVISLGMLIGMESEYSEIGATCKLAWRFECNVLFFARPCA